MNPNALSKLFMPIGLLMVAVFLGFDLLSAGGNAIARLYLYLAVFGFLFGLLAPKRTFYFVLFLTFYLDFMKRLIIFDSGASRMDLYYVLGMAPLAFLGIVFNLLYQSTRGMAAQRPGIVKLFILVAAVATLGGVAAISAGGGFRAVGDAVNSVAYLFLLPVIPLLFPTPGEIRGLLRNVLLMAVPSALYMCVHLARGSLFDWEMDYVKSGLTIEIRQLMEYTFRPFGTLNSAANASVIFASLVALVLGGFWGRALPGPDRSRLGLVGILLLPLLFAVAAYATLSRMGWFIGLMAIPLARIVRTRVGTLATYFVAIILVGIALGATPWLLKTQILNEISGDMIGRGSGRTAQTLNISTLNDRLEGYYEILHTPRVWSPFGLKFQGMSEGAIMALKSHDVVSVLLFRIGYVPLAVLLLVGCFCTFKLHSMVFAIKDRPTRVLASTTLALAMALISGGAINGAQLMTFPTNFYIYFFLGCTIAVAWYRPEGELAEERAAILESWQSRLPTGFRPGQGGFPPGGRPSLSS